MTIKSQRELPSLAAAYGFTVTRSNDPIADDGSVSPGNERSASFLGNQPNLQLAAHRSGIAAQRAQ